MAKVLVIDDDKMVRRILTQMIQYQGFDVEEAVDGEEGLQMIKANRYKVIFCDIQMPKMNGMDMLEKVKALDIQVQIIMLSIQNDVATIAETFKKGAVDFISKPIEPRHFLGALSNCA